MRLFYVLLGVLGTFVVELPSSRPLAEGTARVLVAKRDVYVASTLDRSNVRLAVVRSADVPNDAIHQMPNVNSGQYLKITKRAGQPILRSEVSDGRPIGGPCALDGMRVVLVPDAKADSFDPGDRVDCFSFGADGSSYLILQDIQVFTVDEQSRGTVSVLVKPAAAAKLVLAIHKFEIRLVSAQQGRPSASE
ncbi:MAG: hypothetical protein AB8G99_12635 [Planctomycetaceae bacterium]